MYLMVPFFGTTVTAMMKVAEEVSRKVMGLITLTWKIGILPTNIVVPIYHILVPLVKGTTRNWISHRNLNKIPNRSFEANWYQVYLHWPNGYHFGYQTCHGTIWLGGTQKHLKAPQIITSNEYLVNGTQNRIEMVSLTITSWITNTKTILVPLEKVVLQNWVPF